MKKSALRVLSAVLLLWLLTVPVLAARFLVPVGQVVGLELSDGSVSVAAFDDPLGRDAMEAGLQVGDVILQADHREIHSSDDLADALARSDGSILLSVRRNGSVLSLRLRPVITGQGPKLGVFLRSGISGIGTVTWFDPSSDTFGALGHGVNDSAGKLLSLVHGSAFAASVVGVQPGSIGAPGLLQGQVDPDVPVGTVFANTSRGVFGKALRPWAGEPLPVAQAGQIHTGRASILSNVRGDKIQEFYVEILKLYPASRQDGRNLLLRVTDPELLSRTGGIVQGMSGSPILQDGRIIGAVTHVLVNDPTTGYGIFIENMLDAVA